ncbi:unnamed protein product [Sphagnum balticum]
MGGGRRGHPVPRHPGRISPTSRSKFRQNDGCSQKQTHQLESLLFLPGWKDHGSKPDLTSLNVVFSGVLEPQPAHVHTGQGGGQKLHLERQGSTHARQGQVGHAHAPDRSRGTGHH